MLGAIIGDIVGSIYEFHNHRWKAFELFNKKCFFTDDTVITCAVADSLIRKNGDDIVRTMKEFGRAYPGKGYGAHFGSWLFSSDTKPYYSFGNGAAMRISPVAWIAKSEEEVKFLSKKITEVTHDHPEGLKGAEVTAMCIFKALQGGGEDIRKVKEEIRKYAESKYPEIKRMNYVDLVNNYKFNETCQNTVPQAIYCFLISKNFEDCLRTSVSIGGDTDTLCAISCAIAEAFYGIPKQFKKEVLKYFSNADKQMLLTPINEIYKRYGINNYIPL